MDSIRFNNYRCFSDTGNVSIKPLTFLLGANSSGKSSFLEFFPLLKQSVGVRRNGIFLWYANDVDFKDFENALKSGEKEMKISWTYDDFMVSDGRLSARIKKILRDGRLYSDKVQLRLSMTISARKDSFDKLDELKIEFLDEEIILRIDGNGKVVATVNGRSFGKEKIELRFVDSTFLLPRLITYYETDGSRVLTYSNLLNQENLFLSDEMKEIKDFIQYENMIYLTKKDYETFFKRIVTRQDTDYEYLRDLYLLLSLDDIIEAINYRIQGEAYQLSYVKPLRVMPERYYRYQNYSVDDIESDGKNLAMFLANLTETEVRDFQGWTLKNFGFKIYTIKHEGHIELTIGERKSDARNLVDVGFGYTQLLPIITIIWNSLRGKGRRYHFPRVGNPVKTIAIEQPELHLHPRIQSLFAEVLGKVIAGMSDTMDVRFIIETHSEAIINKIGAMVQSNELSKEKVNVVMFNGENEGLEDYVVEAEFDKDGYLTKWPLGFFL